MANNKRQHFVPRFLLKRFALEDGRWRGHIFRLPTAGGPARPAVPRTEAAKNRYYDLPEELVGEFQPELILGRIESGAAAALARLERGIPPEPDDMPYLAYFAAVQASRTPQDRAERRFLDGFMALQVEELRFSAREQSVAFLRAQRAELTPEEAEAAREEILDGLNAGTLTFESSAEREVASMFLALNQSVGQLLAECDFTLVQVTGNVELVLPDTGYTRYDRNPRVAGTSSGFLGTETVETVIPVTPLSALVLTRGSGRLTYDEAGPEYAEDLNLRAWAQSEACVYGRGQEVVVAAKRLARHRRVDLAARGRQPLTMWILERQVGDPEDRPVLGKGYSIAGVREEWFDVDPSARHEQQALRPEDLWR